MRFPRGNRATLVVAAIVVVLGITLAFASVLSRRMDPVSDAAQSGPSDPEATSSTAAIAERVEANLREQAAVDGAVASAGTSSPGEPGESRTVIPEGASEATSTGATFVAVDRVEAPESYDVVLYFAGWHVASRMPVVEIAEAKLLGAIDPLTGEQTAPPAAGASDHAADLIGLRLMAEPTERVVAELRVAGTYRARLVLMPGEGAVVPRLDRASGVE